MKGAPPKARGEKKEIRTKVLFRDQKTGFRNTKATILNQLKH
ncbi:hypothetical protein A33Q_0218 [Indibacter alkaliphilus LW1]|uniref:Uncharacterized protein n=1 Tax=Indibacter alkaliphilus (strain CCUG 57479 / KCTC 22604 / LW1) TaxID=1189612 RepID=S2DLU3_INDAL|nr:hypothetical protein A33Q_0218 [Indibacter alkaliphilus LW1]